MTRSLIIILIVSKIFTQNVIQYGSDNFLKITEGQNGFNENLDSGDRFGRDHDKIGDVNGDGIIDLVVGARSDDDGFTDAGAVYILFMNNNGTVHSHQKISMLEGGFDENLVEENFFGYGVAGIGDFDNDGIPDISVSATNPQNRAIYIIHLNTDGTVKDFVKNVGIIGQGLSAIGDINGDGRIDLVACDPTSNDGGLNRGAIRILFFNEDSHVMSENTITISSTHGGFGEGLANGDQFGGREVANLGDIDNNGTIEFAVGAFQTDNGRGAIWILSLNLQTFFVEDKIKITQNESGFNETLPEDAHFGHALANVGDLNGDGTNDIITGANQYNEGYGYILYLNENKTVKTYTRINNNEGGFGLTLNSNERFSRSISYIGDLRNDGTIAINVGGGAGNSGVLYILFFNPCNFEMQSGYNYWSGGSNLFSNWNHNSQMVTGTPLSLEQCFSKSFEVAGTNITHKFEDGRCIIKNETANLNNSNEQSLAYIRDCENIGLLGDVNNDGFINIVDIVLTVNLVLANEYNFTADYNSDGTLDILDIVQMVNSILEE